MTYSLKSWFSLGAAAAMFIGASQAVMPSNALAADMLEGEGETLVEFGTGWYLRGDIGGAVLPITTETGVTSGEVDLGNPVTVSFGAGYDDGSGFRYEFGLTQFTSLSAAGRSATGCGTEDDGTGVIVAITGSCYYSVNTDITTSSVTASVYKDLQPMGAFTPYIGLGGGFSYISSTDFSWLLACVGGSSIDCGDSGGAGTNTLASGDYEENSSFALTGNAMIGASYDMSENMKLDFGYKYTYIGSSTLASAASNPFNLSNVDMESLNIHEIRVGLRYEIW